MAKRFVSIWFRHLTTDWLLSASLISEICLLFFELPSHGRMIINATNTTAEMKGINSGMVLADARAIIPNLQVLDDKPDLADKLLKRLAEWCIRFTPIVSIDPPDGLLFDATGCSHLWGGDQFYLAEIVKKLNARGYDVRAAMADTLGVAWAVARFGKEPS